MSILPYSANWIHVPVMSSLIILSCYFDIEGNMASVLLAKASVKGSVYSEKNFMESLTLLKRASLRKVWGGFLILSVPEALTTSHAPKQLGFLHRR